MFSKLRKFALTPAMALLSACGLARCVPEPLDEMTIGMLYEKPLPAPGKQLSIYHLGHSLVGRDMPAMLAQMADSGHSYESQLGWGTPLKGHWTGEINGFEAENAHPHYRDAEEALASGDYDVFVMTEMVEIRDAIKYHDSWDYVHRWAARAREGRGDIRVYLYESWHNTNDPEGWLNRLDLDLGRYWEGEILDRALAAGDDPQPIYVIPVGQVFARFVRALEERGPIDGLTGIESLFDDTIHFNDVGAYLVALTHYAVIYHKSPVGLPNALLKADGTPAEAPGPNAAQLMQETVWEVVINYPRAGLKKDM